MEKYQQQGYAELVIAAKTNKKVLEKLLNQMEPLIKSYSKKLFFLNYEDAQQELRIAILEAVHNIRECKSDGQCLTYIRNAVMFKYNYLCRQNIKQVPVIELDNNYIENLAYVDNVLLDLEFTCDLNCIIQKMSDKQKQIYFYLYQGFSDKEIAKIVSVSRQYINRVKKRIEL